MTALEDLDSRVREQVIYGVDVFAAARKAKKEDISDESLINAASVQDEVRKFSRRLSYSGQALGVLNGFNNKKGLERFVSSMRAPVKGMEYYALLRLILLSLEEHDLAPLFEKWVFINEFPAMSNIMAWDCIEMIMRDLCKSRFKSKTLEEFKGKIESVISSDPQKEHPFFRQTLRYIFAFRTFESNKEVLRRLGSMYTKFCVSELSHLKFPRADETNDRINLIAIASLYVSINYAGYFGGAEIAKRAMLVSYHSIPVLKLYCLSAIASRRPKEVIPIFKTYISYTNDYMVKHGNIRPDPVSVIDTYLTVLKYETSTWKDPQRDVFELVCQWVAELKTVLSEFISNLCDSEDLYNKVLRKYMAGVWYRLGFIYDRLCSVFTFQEGSLQRRIETACKYYEKAAALASKEPTLDDPAFSQLYFRYAVLLAKKMDYAESVKNLKKGLRLQPDSLQHINMITLIYSALDETMNKPYSIAKETVDGILKERLLNEQQTIGGISFDEKYDILQMYMTLISLVEASSSCYEALDSLQDLFDAARRLLGVSSTTQPPDDISSVRRTAVQDGDHTEGLPLVRTVSSKRPSLRDPLQDVLLDNNRSYREDGIRRHRSRVFSLIKGTKNALPGKLSGSSNRRNTQNSIGRQTQRNVTDHASERKLMHDIWLWASKLFEKCGQISDARGCVKEAEDVYKESSESYARAGELLIDSDPKLALQQFEISLELRNQKNLEAVMGLAKLTLSEAGNEVFVGQHDRMAALGRCKNYLELMRTDYDTSTVPEVYYYLSKIYKEYNDKAMEENMLWRTVQLEDDRPVRSVDQVIRN